MTLPFNAAFNLNAFYLFQQLKWTWFLRILRMEVWKSTIASHEVSEA